MFDVLVNCWRLIMTAVQRKPDAVPAGSTCSSRRIRPFLTSPTSNATQPPGRVTRCSSRKTFVIAHCHAPTSRASAALRSMAAASMPLNQQRSQLSFAYCTVSRNGGEVTVSATEASGICGVSQASAAMKTACRARRRIASRRGASRPDSSCRDFLAIRSRTFLYGGAWRRLRLIRTCPSRDAAWFGGSV